MRDQVVYQKMYSEKPQHKSTTIKAAWTQLLVGISAILALFVGDANAILTPDMREAFLEFIVPITTIVTSLVAWRGRVKATDRVKGN